MVNGVAKNKRLFLADILNAMDIAQRKEVITMPDSVWTYWNDDVM